MAFRERICARPNSSFVFLCPLLRFPFCMSPTQAFEQFLWYCPILLKISFSQCYDGSAKLWFGFIFLASAITDGIEGRQLCYIHPVAVVDTSRPHCYRYICQCLDLIFICFPCIPLSGATSTFFSAPSSAIPPRKSTIDSLV